jgi:hypothetical protein
VGKQRRWRAWGSLFVLMLVVALGGGSAIAAAANTTKKASLNITVPASAPNHTQITVTLSGQAGKYNEVSVATYASKCSATVLSATNSAAVKPMHKFKVKLSTSAGNHPGTYYACAYLYNTAHRYGSNIHKSKTFHTT